MKPNSYLLDLDRQPSVVDIQILRVGQFVILCVPGEFTTMAGRRLREAVTEKVQFLSGFPFLQLIEIP